MKKLREKIGHDPIFMPAVACFIYKDGKLLLQRRTDDSKWAAHGGAMEFGEEILETLDREIMEELGVKPINPQFLKVYAGKDLHYFYPGGDEVYGVTIFYLVEEYEGDLKINPEEVSEIKWFDINGLPELRELHKPDVRPIMEVVEYLKGRGNKANYLAEEGED